MKGVIVIIHMLLMSDKKKSNVRQCVNRMSVWLDKIWLTYELDLGHLPQTDSIFY